MITKESQLDFAEAMYKGGNYIFYVMCFLINFIGLPGNYAIPKYDLLYFGILIFLLILIIRLRDFYIDRGYPEIVKIFKSKPVFTLRLILKLIMLSFLILGYGFFVFKFIAHFVLAEDFGNFATLFLVLLTVFALVILPLLVLRNEAGEAPNYYDKIILTKTQLIVYYLPSKIMKFNLYILDSDWRTEDDIFLEAKNINSLLLNIGTMGPEEKEDLRHRLEDIKDKEAILKNF